MPTPRQPLLHHDIVVLHAPVQAWSHADGSMGTAPIHGVYMGDTRVINTLALTVAGEEPEHLTTSELGAHTVLFDYLARSIDTESADPEVRLRRERSVTVDSFSENITVINRHAAALVAPLSVRLGADSSRMDAVKAGLAAPAQLPLHLAADGVTWGAHDAKVAVSHPGWDVRADGNDLILTCNLEVPARSHATAIITVALRDSHNPVIAAHGPASWKTPLVRAEDGRLSAWVTRSLEDLSALRMSLRALPGSEFLAAGAPWFFTLFGRDSLWAARFMLPLGTDLAANTLRVLAHLQGSHDDPASAEEPGKIMHEIRSSDLDLPDVGVHLPPLYYGTVDATALWICLLHEAWQWGLADHEVEQLLPHLERALAWMRDYGDADGDGFLEYLDKSGRGLANQGWKDSGDSIQWRDGTLAKGPIALCEVQAYAYQAAMGGAELLDHFGRQGAQSWRDWAAALKSNFKHSFWITDPEITGDLGPYPAVALDAHKRKVDTVTSNLGHLLGTGILDAEEAALVAARLSSPQMNSGRGLRTMSTDSIGYWPMSYHGGSVWTHDTAIAIRGLALEGFAKEAATLSQGLLEVAELTSYRMPELHGGDSSTKNLLPYPAACRPQAWSAASSIVVLQAATGWPAPTGPLADAVPVAGEVSVTWA